VLQGLESEQAARDVEALLRRFEIVSMAGDAIPVAGARNFPFFAPARDHSLQDDRPLDRDLVHRKPCIAAPQR
jgi:hypothetical protein